MQISHLDVPASHGNRCGHSPLAPRFYQPPSEHKARPWVLEKAKVVLQRFYVEPLQFLADLCTSARQRRSERREAIAALGQTLLHYVDLITLKVGIALQNGPMRCLTLDFLAKRAGLGLKRAQRALQDLAKAGYITIEKRYRAHIDRRLSIKGLPAIKTLTAKFFVHLGIDYALLVRQREWNRKQQEMRPRSRERLSFVQRVGQGITQSFKTNQARANNCSKAQRRVNIETEKAKAELAFQLLQQGHTYEEIRNALKARYPAVSS